MKRILFICLGNICRSPMAEFIMKDLVKKAKKEDEYVIDSMGVSYEEYGNPIHRGARAKMDKEKVPYKMRYATVIKPSDYNNYDHILCMDDNNLRALMRITNGDPENKRRKLLQEKSVADPYYTGDFEPTYQDILLGCKRLLNNLEN